MSLAAQVGSTVGVEEREQVWRELSLWDFGNPNAHQEYTFKFKLVKKMAWSEEYAERVMDEFRRFVFLWVCYPEITHAPSPDVDEVWHFALQFLRRYERMCNKFCGGLRYHNPSSGPEDRDRLRICYSDTLQRYQEAFGECPPTDIWPQRQHDTVANNCDNGCGQNCNQPCTRCSDDECG